jgi:hypothetical protein
MEYVIVKYPSSREVFINGKKNGLTNESLRVNAGTSIFDLGEPGDYHPASQEIEVTDTTVLEPLEIEFHENGE